MTDSKAAVSKAKRVPVGRARTRLSLEFTDPNYIFRWVNDVADRIGRFQLGGYLFATKEDVGDVGVKDVATTNPELNKDSGRIVRVVNKNGVKAYLMKIHKDLYDEDQAAKEEEVARTDEAMRAGTHGGGVERGYIKPNHSIGSMKK